MRFGFLLKRGKPEARAVAADLVEVVASRGNSAVQCQGEPDLLPDVPALPLERFAREIDVLVVLGGDGTFLHGAALAADEGVPLLGINLGQLGFMTHYVLGEARAAIDAVAAGRLPIEERMRLRVGVHKAGREVEVRHGLNEAVIAKGGKARLLDLAVAVDGAGLTTYKADGLIVSTPTGSTAYSLAAGGPILTPDLEAMVLTPICPHTLTNRPVVLRGDARLVISNVSRSTVIATIDGQWSCELPPEDTVEIRKADRPLRTYRAPSDYFAILREKLSWGGRG